MGALHPGMVTVAHIRDKLSKQLKIALEPHEMVHIHPLHTLSHEELDYDHVQRMVEEFEPEGECQTQIKRLGEYVAKISLDGGHSAALRFVVLQRLP